MGFSTSRRTFLKSSLLTTLALSVPGAAFANFSIKKQLSGPLHLYNIHTGEAINTTFRDREGRYNPLALKELNWFLRCHYTDQQHTIDLKTLDFLDRLSARLGRKKEIHIISGYRSPEYNNYLLSLGHKVAKHSLHLEGRALDIRIPDTSLSNLRQAALSLHLGGVGYYPGEDFVHVDSGKFRTW